MAAVSTATTLGARLPDPSSTADQDQVGMLHQPLLIGTGVASTLVITLIAAAGRRGGAHAGRRSDKQEEHGSDESRHRDAK
ncbi:hypothetical protein ISF_02105 [Cordyceps fumosorosea ARSEF 2679]|uniref:Uncharacterized protein n=1 Tax=Cordyceps fumosorosea (strain ARSEF 2679) TaxID=1081104 RepID=A0A162LJT1_CORFA|nr:hypothetical protein ISF_02105 [Cordyceps fumosorosea ARSEF 2679]OAA71554.1 hypothetical protein ISF_02105 [Cordyceps fumosorosea ARSEF 2679]